MSRSSSTTPSRVMRRPRGERNVGAWRGASPPSARGLRASSAASGPRARGAAAAGAGANGARRDELAPLARDEGLDDPVLSEWKLITTSRRPGEQRERRAQRSLELLELLVDENPKSLKRARRRVLACLSGLDRTSHDVGKLGCGSNGAPALAPSNKRLCNL